MSSTSLIFYKTTAILKDLFGKALLNYHQQPGKQELITWTSLTDEDPVPISYFFREYADMPEIEQKALELAFGKVLDVGCGSGSHSLYLQNDKKLEVVGIDRSSGAIEVAQQRGVKRLYCQSILEFNEEKFDSLLLLMNGLGVAQDFKSVLPLLAHLKKLMKPQGQILIDSSDLIYLFPDEVQLEWKMADTYYGELDYGIRFNGKEEQFPWLYLDFDHLKAAALQAGLVCTKILDGPNHDYLARLSIKEF